MMESYNRLRIAVAGAGYVGLSNATLLARQHKVTVVDIDIDRVNKINRRESTVHDEYIERYFAGEFGVLDISATTDADTAYKNADVVIIAVPTNYDSSKQGFDTSSIEDVVNNVIKVNKDAVMLIKSTISIGYTKSLYEDHDCNINLLFSPEFLREGFAMYDCLHPSRIIIGAPCNDEKFTEYSKMLLNLFKDAALDGDIQTFQMGSGEAEAVKLFANTYLAMRVAYFNELDTYAEMKDLDTKSIIEGVCADPRIGEGYNNPSFGYGGYCLPKDSMELRSIYDRSTPVIKEKMISAIVESNKTRKTNIGFMVIAKTLGTWKPVIGVYRLTMKSGSDNFRESAVLDIVKMLRDFNINVVVFEPNVNLEDLKKLEGFKKVKLVNDFDEFAKASDLIIANRYDQQLDAVKEKVYTRDIFFKY